MNTRLVLLSAIVAVAVFPTDANNGIGPSFTAYAKIVEYINNNTVEIDKLGIQELKDGDICKARLYFTAVNQSIVLLREQMVYNFNIMRQTCSHHKFDVKEYKCIGPWMQYIPQSHEIGKCADLDRNINGTKYRYEESTDVFYEYCRNGTNLLSLRRNNLEFRFNFFNNNAPSNDFFVPPRYCQL